MCGWTHGGHFAHSCIHHPLLATFSTVLFLHFPILHNLCHVFPILPRIPCIAEGMQQPDWTQGDRAEGQTLQLSPCLAHTCSHNQELLILLQPQMAWHWQCLLPQLPQQPFTSNYPTCPGAHVLMWGSIPPAPCRAGVEKSPLPTAAWPVPGTGNSGSPQVFGTCCLPRFPAAAWPALLSPLAAGSSRWKAICLTWCERDFTGVRTLDDRGEGGLKWTPSIFLMQNECRHIALISSL